MAHNPGQRRSGDSTSALYITKYRPEDRAALILITTTSQLFYGRPDERFVRVDTTMPLLLEFSKTDLALNSIIDSSNFASGEQLLAIETVTGQTSGATATVESFVPAAIGSPGSELSISGVSGEFVDGEVVLGGTSGFSVTIGQFRLGGTAEPAEPDPGSLRVDEFGFEWLQLGPHAQVRIRAEAVDADVSLVWGSSDFEDGP